MRSTYKHVSRSKLKVFQHTLSFKKWLKVFADQFLDGGVHVFFTFNKPWCLAEFSGEFLIPT